MASQVQEFDAIEFASPLLPSASTHHPAVVGYSLARSVIMVAICSLTLFLNNGFMLVGISVFDPLMMQRLGVSVGTLKAGDTITFVTVALAAPMAGYLIDRIGPRLLFVSGMSIMSGGLGLYGISTSVTVVYAIHVLFGLCLVLCGAFACLIVVSEATDKRRGMAIGILLATASLGAAISPTIFSDLQKAFGWQWSLYIVATFTACMLPLVFLFVPDRLRITSHVASNSTRKATLGSSIRSRNFWFLGIVAAIGYLVAIGVTSNMILFLTKDLHLGVSRINLTMLVLFVTVLLTQLATGVLTDILNRRVMHTVCIVTMALGCVLLSLEQSYLVWAAVILFAIGWGGNYVLLQYLLTHLFSGPSIGRIIGVIGVIEALGGSIGPVLIGGSYDLMKSYSLAFLIMAMVLIGTAFIASQIRKAVA